jgi:hypothetical protein
MNAIMRKKHIYSVVMNQFSEPFYFIRRRDAEKYAEELMRFERYAGHTVTGSARSGFRSSSGYIIEITGREKFFFLAY